MDGQWWMMHGRYSAMDDWLFAVTMDDVRRSSIDVGRWITDNGDCDGDWRR